ncbi:MAG: hypothetical protein WCB27_21525 [Thermoguttaceae bacterium]
MESKIELNDRLRREGRWNEAAVWKDAKIKELRATGMKRAEAKEEAWRLMAERFPPLPKPEPDEDDDDYGDDFDDELEQDELDDDPDVEDLWRWLDGEFGGNLDPFLAKLVKITKEWSQFEEQWCRDRGLSLDDNAKHALHQVIADFICYRLWPPPPSTTFADTFGSPETRTWLIGEGIRSVIRAIREWRDRWFGGERLNSDTTDELHRLVAALLCLVVDGRLGSSLESVVNCRKGLFLTVEHRPEPPKQTPTNASGSTETAAPRVPVAAASEAEKPAVAQAGAVAQGS